MRNRKSKNRTVLVVSGAIVVGVLAAYFVFSGAAASLVPELGRGKYATFSADGFLENPKTHAGNRYRIEGVIDNILDSQNPGEGMVRLVSLSTAEGQFIPVLVPEKNVAFALQRGQGTVVFCQVNKMGLPVAELIDKQ